MNMSGFYAFRDSPWHFPIFWTDRLNYPEGLSIINTDSIPFWYYPNSSVLNREFGFGVYSMNLLAPFVGGKLILWGEAFQAVSPKLVLMLAAAWVYRHSFRRVAGILLRTPRG